MKRLLSALAILLLLAARQASADMVFSLSGVTFNDGGTLTGTFTTTDALNALVTYDLTTSGGTAVGFEYTPATAPVDFSVLPTILVVETAAADHILEVTFISPPGLAATGATIKIGEFDSFEQSGTVHRSITAGAAVPSTTATPEPSTMALLGIAVLGVLVCVRARQT